MAQNSEEATISGTVLNPEGEPLVGASVAVYDSTDSDIVTGMSTEPDGSFELDVEPENYILRVEYVSYADYTERLELEPGENMDLGEFQMDPTAEQLDEIVVEDERSEMEMNFDSRTFDVGADVTNMGGSALEVLDNVPSVTTDYEGNVSLRGSDGVQILINGRPSSLVSDGTDGLSRIPANMVEDVEVITNPSARYSAEGTGGIINIILKDNAQLGFNGSVNAEVSNPQEYELGADLNYNPGGVNWFFSPNVEYEKDPGSSRIFQSDVNGSEATAYNRVSDSNEFEVDGGFRLGADIFLPRDQILTAYSYVDIESGEDESNIIDTEYNVPENQVYREIDDSWDIDQRISEDELEEARERDVDFNLQYENQFDGSDHRLTADASFDFGTESEDVSILRELEEGTGSIGNDQRTFSSETYRDLRLESDYEQPVGENGRFEAGFRSTFDWMDSDYSAEELVDGSWQSLPDFTDNFEYMENVNALYSSYSGEVGSFTYQAGLRLENTRIQTQLDQSGEGSDQNYTNLFPSLFLTYKLNDSNSFQVSYSRRISRPWSRMLLPFSDVPDSRNQFVGNPELEPEFGDSYEAGYMRYWDSGSALASVYYRYRTGEIERVTREVDGMNVRQPINLSTEKSYGLELTADQDLLEGLQLSGSLNLFNSNSDGEYQGEELGSDSNVMSSRIRLRWRFLDGWNVQSSMRYISGRGTAQGQEEASTFVDTGLARSFLDEKLRVSFSVNDLLESRGHNETVNNSDLFRRQEFQWSTRSFSLDLQYNFGGGEQQSRGRRGGGPPGR